MTMILLALAYAAGFAFFLGYSRGMGNGEHAWCWQDLAVALMWPVAVMWLADAYWEGHRRSIFAVAFALLAFAAPTRATTYTLAVSTAGPFTTTTVVTSTPSGIVCPPTCSAVFAASTTVTLGAVWPSTTAFASWGGISTCNTNDPTCTLTLYANAAVSASFDPILSLAFSGNGIGVLTSTGVVAYSTAQAAGATWNLVYPKGTTVVLNQSTGTTSSFVGWSGDGGCGTASTCTVTLNGSEVVTATFTANGAGPYRMAVSVPLGGGTVSSSPAGILTSAGVYSSTFTAGASVTFTTAALAGYRFAGWSNAGCSKNNKCVVVSTSPLQGLGGPWSPAAYFYPLP